MLSKGSRLKFLISRKLVSSVHVRLYIRTWSLLLLSVTYLSVYGNASHCLSGLLHLYTSSRPLRSASRSPLEVPRPRDSLKRRYGQRAFRYVAPSLWNALPVGIGESDSIWSVFQGFLWKLTSFIFTKICSVMMLLIILAVVVRIVVMVCVRACVGVL